MKRKDPKYKYKYALLLDDNELDNFINQKIIEVSYFANKIYVNTSSKSALEFLINLSISSVDTNVSVFPEIIFVDINMPMMDGFQFIENLKSKLPEKIKDLKLVILTSSVNPEDKQRAQDISLDIAFLNKPLTKEMLDQL